MRMTNRSPDLLTPEPEHRQRSGKKRPTNYRRVRLFKELAAAVVIAVIAFAALWFALGRMG